MEHNRIVTIQDWENWFDLCAFGRCDAETQKRFNIFCQPRLEKATQKALWAENNRRRATGKSEIFANSVIPPHHPENEESPVYYQALHEVDVWAALATPAKNGEPEKNKKKWLEAHAEGCRDEGGKLACYEGTMTQCIQTDIARQWLKNNNVYARSIDEPRPIASGDSTSSSSAEDYEDAKSEGRGATENNDYSAIATSIVDDILKALQEDPVSRLVFACFLRGIPISTDALLKTIKLRKSAASDRAGKIGEVIQNAITKKLGGNLNETTLDNIRLWVLKIWTERDLRHFPPEKAPWDYFNSI